MRPGPRQAGYLVGAIALAALYAFRLGLPSRPPVLFAVVASAIVLTVAASSRRVIDRTTAALFIGGFALFELGDLSAYASYLEGTSAGSLPGLQDVFYYAGYPFFVAAITRRYARDRRAAAAAILFSLTLAVACGFVLWATVFSQFAEKMTGATVMAAAYPMLDLVLVIGVAQAAAAGLPRRETGLLLMGSLAFLTADIGYAIVGLRGPYTGSFYLPAFYVIAYASYAAGISSSKQGESTSLRPLRLSMYRVSLMFAAIVMAPFALIAARLNDLNAYVAAGWIAVVVVLVFGQFCVLLSEFGVAETRLRVRERELQTLADNAPALLWATDHNLQATSVRGAASTRLGWGLDTLTRWSRLLDSDLHPDFVRAHRQALDGEVVTFDHEIDGRIFRCQIEPLTAAGGKSIGTIGVGIDVTEEVRLERQIREAQKLEAVGQLAGTIAHDFNNVLTGISGYAELAAAKLHEHPAVRDIAEIRRASDHAAALTKRLSVFSHQREPEPNVVDANGVVAGLAAFLDRVIGESMSVRYELDSSEAPVKIDPQQIEQVILNLAINARDAMSSRGEIAVAAYTMAEQFVLEVRDQGVGMDAETQERIFDPFFTTKEQGKGTGLGLASVRSIVLDAGGTIDVNSTPGVGTTFRVLLPLDRTANQEGVTSEPQSDSLVGGTESILLVDDNDLVRNLTAEMLRDLGYRVATASSSRDAIAVATQSAFDLLLTDVVLPDIDGRRLVDRLGAIRADIPVLFVSGFVPSEEFGGEMESASVSQAFLSKPFTLRELDSAVRAMLDGGNRANS